MVGVTVIAVVFEVVFVMSVAAAVVVSLLIDYLYLNTSSYGVRSIL